MSRSVRAPLLVSLVLSAAALGIGSVLLLDDPGRPLAPSPREPAPGARPAPALEPEAMNVAPGPRRSLPS